MPLRSRSLAPMTSRSSTLPPVGLVIGLVIALVIGLAGCGDDDVGGADTTTSTSTTVADTTATDDSAEDPPSGDPGEDDGLGDPLVFVADLTADTEVPGPGDDDGAGRIEIESAAVGEWCIDMEVAGLGADVTDSHIHFGPAGNSGDVVIPIGAPTASGGDTETWTDVCVTVADDLVAEIVDAPDAFYANVHTADFGGGAVRGQLESSTIFDLVLS